MPCQWPPAAAPQVLLTHAASGDYSAWADGQTVEALSGQNLTLGTDPRSVMVTGALGMAARITSTERSCAGPVYIIDKARALALRRTSAELQI